MKKRNEIMPDYEGSVMLETTIGIFALIAKKIFFWILFISLVILFIFSFKNEGINELFSTKLTSLEIPAQINIIIIIIGISILYFGKGKYWLIFALISLISMFTFFIKFMMEFSWTQINTLYLFTVFIALAITSYTPFLQSVMDDPYEKTE